MALVLVGQKTLKYFEAQIVWGQQNEGVKFVRGQNFWDLTFFELSTFFRGSTFLGVKKLFGIISQRGGCRASRRLGIIPK